MASTVAMQTRPLVAAVRPTAGLPAPGSRVVAGRAAAVAGAPRRGAAPRRSSEASPSVGLAAAAAAAAGILAGAGRSARHGAGARRPRRVAVAAVAGGVGAVGADHGAAEAESGGDLPRKGAALRVAIAGGGVGGLTAALSMMKAGFDVTIYEKTGEFARFGGPIQFASNALSTLKAIDERLFDRVMSKFTFTGTRRCGIKDGLRADGSFRMTDVANPAYLFDSTVPADWFVSFPLNACADFFKLPYTGVINRPDLQDILLDECRQRKPDFIKNGSPVVGYENHDNGVTVKLADGTTEEADILVGADGIWSAVRSQMYNEGPVKQFAADKKTRQGCRYSGYTVFAGETVLKLGDYYECGYKVYIGPKRYFVTSDVGDGRIQWYAFLALPPGTNKAGDTWEGEGGSAKQGADVIDYLKSLHEGWSSEVFEVLDNTPVESVEQRDLYDRLPEFFRSWADGSTVLVGDAVHPMMPNLGQGGCQAIEDAYELTKALSAVRTYSGTVTSVDEYRGALQDFYRSRLPRVSAISLLSGIASDLIINAFDTPWSPHDNKGIDWKSYLTFAWKPILQYLVFPAQFLFLYSYHPSGGMGTLPQKLVAAWEERHKASAEAAFARVEREGQKAGGPSFFAKAETEEGAGKNPLEAAVAVLSGASSK